MPSAGADSPKFRPASFFARALSGGSSGERKASSTGLSSNGHASKAEKEQRRLSTAAPLPPSLSSKSPSLPSEPSPPLASPSTPTRPSALRSSSSHSLASSSAPPPLPRKVSFDDRPSLARSSTSRSSLSAASASSSARRASLFAPSSADAEHPATPRRGSTTSIQNGRPVSSVFPSRPSSVYSASSAPGPTPGLRASTSRSSMLSGGVSVSEEEEEGDAASARAPRGVGAAQMDALVDGMRRGSLTGSVAKDGEAAQQRARRPRRREDSSAPSAWGSLSGSAASASSAHSREASTASDASFASLSAAPTPAELAGPLLPAPSAAEAGYLDLDVTGAPSMARQETLKAIARPWMASVVVGVGGGPVVAARTPQEIIEAYRVGATCPATPRQGSAEAGLPVSRACPQREGLTPPRSSLLNGGVRTPPPGMRGLSLSPSPGPSPRTARRASFAKMPDPPVLNGHNHPPSPPPSQPSPPPSQPSPPPDPSPPPPPPKPPMLAYVPFPVSAASSLALPDPQTPTRAKSIEEIIAQHAPPAYLSARRPSASAPPPVSSAPTPARTREDSARTQSSQASRGSADSLAAELRRTSEAQSVLGAELAGERTASPAMLKLPSIGGVMPAGGALSLDEVGGSAYAPSIASSSPAPRVTSPRLQGGTSADEGERELARLLKSPRLTRLFTLREPPNAGLTVSLADVGAPSGHPVLVFLGLGSVRYLVALYDELADALGLRLICIDRWGLGRTSAVPDAQRGFVEWSSVVAELASPAHLDLGAFSILAHSAGAPYAVAATLHGALAPRVRGAVHLLAPWVSGEADSLAGMYRYLKYVPSGVLKTAQAAEWRMQGWRLGKPPALVHAPVGWDAKTGRLMNGEELEHEEERRSEAAGEGVVLLNGGSPTNTRKLEDMYPEGALIKAGPAATLSPGKGRGLKASIGGLFGAGSPKRSPAGGNVDPFDASPGSRNSLLLPSPSPNRRASFFGGMSRSTPPPESSSTASSRSLAPSGLPMPSRRSSIFSLSPSSSPTTPTTPVPARQPSLAPSIASSHAPAPTPPPLRRERLSSTASASTHSSSSLPRERERTPIAPGTLIDGLLRASHAESLGGGTSDLLVLLERTASPSEGSGRGMGFAYADVPHRVKVWYGDRDDRISLGSIRWLEKELDRGVAGAGGKACEVRIVEGADHGLMANSRVMLEVLESIADEWSRR
ncbi:hypothetical protein JCM10449v2_001097 [Rhodotorula kratochvilovae]